MSLFLLLLLISWAITAAVGAFAIWLFFRYGRLLLRSSGIEVGERPRRLSRSYDVAISLGTKCEVAHQLIEEKYRRRIDRFRETVASGRSIAFVRHEMSRDEALELRNLIRTRFPNLEFLLVAVNERPHEQDDWDLDQVINFSVHGVEGWYGNGDAYGEVFEAVHLTRLVKTEDVVHTH